MRIKSKPIHADKKRHGSHHKHSTIYKKVYWPYLPVLAALLVILAITLFHPISQQKVLSYATDISGRGLLEATNEKRQANGQKPLLMNQRLTDAAQAKANDMAARDYWSHNTPEGQAPWVFIDQAGYSYRKAGENLAYGFKNNDATIIGWMNSQEHRENLLDAEYQEVGFGFANANNYQKSGQETIVVAMYGEPSTTPVAGATTTQNTPAPKAVSKLDILSGGRLPWASFVVGLVGGMAVMGLFINHGLRLRRLFTRSEKYLAAHPLLDVTLVSLVAVTVALSQTVGYIH